MIHNLLIRCILYEYTSHHIIDSYKDVEVRFISGKKAVLTIFKDGKEQEKITLSDYNDTDKLHALFAEKGFTKYSEVELVEQRKMKEAEDKKNGGTPAGGLRVRKAHDVQKRFASQTETILSPRLRKKEMKEKLKALKEARENFMVVGQPIG